MTLGYTLLAVYSYSGYTSLGSTGACILCRTLRINACGKQLLDRDKLLVDVPLVAASCQEVANLLVHA